MSELGCWVKWILGLDSYGPAFALVSRDHPGSQITCQRWLGHKVAATELFGAFQPFSVARGGEWEFRVSSSLATFLFSPRSPSIQRKEETEGETWH